MSDCKLDLFDNSGDEYEAHFVQSKCFHFASPKDPGAAVWPLDQAYYGLPDYLRVLRRC
jgi:hypothetical protein